MQLNLQSHRPWITPLIIGSFLLVSITGVLMFFHLDSGLNKLAHEWLSLVMVVGAALHILLNLPAFKRYFSQRTGRSIMALFALMLSLSFINTGNSQKEPPFAAPVHKLAQVPLPVLAQVLGVTPEVLHQKLSAKGLALPNEKSTEKNTLEDLVGKDLRRQVQTLNSLITQS